jgi:cytochrome c553
MKLLASLVNRISSLAIGGGLRLALQTAILAGGFAATGYAADTDAVAISERELQAKTQYCTYCHQPSGQGYVGAYPIPRLAGQQTQYIVNQLKAFIERRRDNKLMSNVADSLNPEMLTALAKHFSDLDAKPLDCAPKELVATGKKIFEEGVPDSHVPPCSTCHGPEAKGNGAAPRLAGQLYPYVINVLVNWDKERGQDPADPDTSAIMAPIARGLTESQIKAVAAYLNYLE